jgi:hypothetical protein
MRSMIAFARRGTSASVYPHPSAGQSDPPGEKPLLGPCSHPVTGNLATTGAATIVLIDQTSEEEEGFSVEC